jgi:hypothetical protein
MGIRMHQRSSFRIPSAADTPQMSQVVSRQDDVAARLQTEPRPGHGEYLCNFVPPRRSCATIRTHISGRRDVLNAAYPLSRIQDVFHGFALIDATVWLVDRVGPQDFDACSILAQAHPKPQRFTRGRVTRSLETAQVSQLVLLRFGGGRQSV